MSVWMYIAVTDPGYGNEQNDEFMKNMGIEAFVKYNYFHKEQKRTWNKDAFTIQNLKKASIAGHLPSIFILNRYFYKRSSALKHFTNLPIAKSICSLECVAINEKRINVSFGEHAGGTTGFTNTPSSNNILVTINVFSISRTYRGMIGVEVCPISKPSSRKHFKE
mgnify:CR=1 FL=1